MNIEQLNMNQMFWLQSRHSIPTFEPLIPLQVNIYQMYSRYIDDVPSIIVSLYLGPLSGEIDSKAWDGNLPQIPEGSQSCWFLFWGTSYQVGFSNKSSAIKKTSPQELSWSLSVSSPIGMPGVSLVRSILKNTKLSISQIYLVIWIVHSLRWLFLA